MAEIQLKTYQFRGSSNKKSDGKWYPRVEHYSTIKADELSRLAAEDSRIERSEVQYVTAAIVKQVIELVMNGHSIKVPELGTFSISAESATVDSWDDVRCDTMIRQLRLNLRVTDEMRQALKRCTLRIK